MFVRLAVGVRSARYVVARIHTSPADAGEDVVAIVVRGALVLRDRDPGATGSVRVAHGSLRTLADVVALRVDAVGAVSARVVRALVHVHAAVLGVSFVACLAHAPWRIAGCTLRVYTAWEPVARILAEVSIERIRVEWRWTDALSGLHALLVSFALAVAGAPFLSWRTESIIGISAVAVWTDALVGSWKVYALRSVAAHLVSDDALVYIFARTVNLCSVSLGTSTVTHSASNGNTLRSIRTLFSLRTSGQHALSINNLVRRLTLALDTVTFFAKGERIPVEPRRTLALVASRQVLTNCVHTASRLIPELHALVDVSAFTTVVVPGVPSLTNAHAAAHELVLDALFSSRTGGAWSTDVRSF